MARRKRRPGSAQLSPMAPSSSRSRPWWRSRLSGVAVLAVVAILGAWSLWRRPPRTDAEARTRLLHRTPSPRDLNVVVLTLDTLRADRLGCYGFKGASTPHLDSLAREGVLFEKATAAVPLTFPSHSSMFTGLLPPHHGVRDNGGFFLDASKTTLAEYLKGAGYATGAFVGAWVLESKWGLDQGFDHYADHFDLSRYKAISLGTVQKPGDEVMDGALKWLEEVRGRRFFAWVHLYDPHTPYEPPEPYRSRYPGQPYLGEVAYTDAVVGRLLGWLRESGLLERTLVIAIADHGESLGEHGEATHAYFVYDSTMSVPFIVRTPWGDHGRVRAQVSGVDLTPTVLDLLGLPPPGGLDGRSLARLVLDPAAEAPRSAYVETYFPRYHFGWQHLRGLRDGKYKYIEAPDPELYDIDKDPGETANIYKAFSKRADDMRQAMERLAGEAKGEAPERQKLDPDTLQRLAALGYVGNVADADPDAVLPDPKSKAHLFVLMNAAKEAAQADRVEEAITKMQQVVAEDPGIVDAHLTLGNWLSRARRPDEAIAAFKRVLALKPDNDLAMLNLAHIYRARRQTEAAVAGYRGVLKLDPKNAQAWYQLATLYLDEGDVARAESTFREALKANPRMGAAYNSLAVIAYARQQVAEAERLVRQGLELEPEVRTGRFNLGRILEAKGEVAGAEALYREELRTYPDHGKARFNLAQILRARGDRGGFLGELKALVERAPEFGPGYFFLAREELNAGRLEAAADLARRGLGVDSASEVAPLGYYVLADVYSRQGQTAKAQQEVIKARQLEAALKRHPLPPL